MKETTNYKFKKPDGTDFVGPNPFNENADIIDEKLKSLEDGKADGNHNHDSSYYGKENLDTKFQNVNESITKKGNCNARFLQGETIPVDAWVARTNDLLTPEVIAKMDADGIVMQADLAVAGIDGTWRADIAPIYSDIKLFSINVTGNGFVRLYADKAGDVFVASAVFTKAVT